MDDIAREFEQQTGVRVIVSYGSTAQLAQQIEHGGPFDLFAAADTVHIDDLIAKGKLRRESRAVYARGQLVAWRPDASVPMERLEDLTSPSIRFIAVAQPDLAPYGHATVQALKAAGIWEQVRKKVTYANSISMAKQFASSGNADVAFTALSLVMKERGSVLKVDPRLYQPIDQALAISAATEIAPVPVPRLSPSAACRCATACWGAMSCWGAWAALRLRWPTLRCTIRSAA